MSTSLPDLSTRITVDTSDLERAVQKGSTLGSAFGSFAGNIAANAVGGAIEKVTEFVGSSVDAFAELEDATAAAGVIFGSGMGKVATFAETAAEKLGLSKQQAIDASATFGIFGKSAGLTGDDLAGFSTQMAQTAGDMASFKGTTPEQAIEAVGAALRGESEPIRAYGVLLDDASLRQEALKQGLIKTTSQALTPQQKVLAAHALILKQTSDAQGDFARTSDSTANTQKRLAAETANAQAQLGAKLAPAMTAVRGVLLLGIEAITGFIEVLTPLGHLLGQMARFVADNAETFAALGAVLGALVVVTNGTRIALALLSIQSKVAAAATRAQAAATAALNAVMALNPIGIVVLALVALAAGLVIAYRHSETFRDIVNGAFHAVQVAIGNAVSIIILAFKSVLDVWLTVADGIISGAAHALGWIPGLGGKLKEANRAFDRMRAGIDKTLQGMADDAGRAGDKAPRSVASGVRSGTAIAVSAAQGLANKTGAPLKALVTEGRGWGRSLDEQIAAGIRSSGASAAAARGIAAKIAAQFPGSPVKEGPLTAFNDGRAGAMLGWSLADGLDRALPLVAAAADRMAGAAAGTPGTSRLAPVGVGGAPGGAPVGGTSWAPTVQVSGVFSDPHAAAKAAVDQLTWQARLEGATL